MLKFVAFMTPVSFLAEFLQSGEIIVSVSLGKIFLVAFKVLCDPFHKALLLAGPKDIAVKFVVFFISI